MSMNKYLKQLRGMEGAVDREYNPFEHVIRTGSPSFDWVYGRGMGLPLGYSEILFGPPKSGKSLVTYMRTGWLHQNDPEAIAIKFNTELREGGQIAPYWGIDPERYVAFDVNEPELIFDRIKKEILPMIQDGLPVKYIAIDSLQNISGVKEMNRDSVSDHLVGDLAQTIQNGLKLILPIIRRNRIALSLTSHVRANVEMNGNKGKDTKMAGGWYQKHFGEYFVSINRGKAAEDKASLEGVKFEDSEVKDMRGNKDRTGHKILAKMEESSVGVDGRIGTFTLDYNKGLINTHEELFMLGNNLGLITQSGAFYEINGKKYHGKAAASKAFTEDPELARHVMSLLEKQNCAKSPE
jgi:recombination protein RecA